MSYTPEVQNFTSVLNSTNIPLASGETFQGTGENVEKWGTISVSVFTPIDEPTAGTLYFEVSRDGINYGGPSRVFTNTSTSQPHMWTVAEKYFRIRYINGSSTASTFQIQTQYSVNRPLILGHQVNETILDEYETTLVKSISVGKDPVGAYTNHKTDGYIFSTTNVLQSGSTYNSSVLSTNGYNQIQVEAFSDVAGLFITYWYSADGITLIRTTTRLYDGDKVGQYYYISSPTYSPYFKITYYNSTTPQSTFYLATKFTTQPISGQIVGITDEITSNVVANIGRNILVGENKLSGVFDNVAVTQSGNLPVEIKGPSSAFGDMRTQIPTPQCQIDFVYGLNTNTTITGGTGIGSASAVTNNPVIALNSGAQSGSSATLYSRRYMKYRPGQGGLCRITNIFASGKTGSLQLMGIGDTVNGYFFGYSGSTFGIIHRKNSVDTFIPQSSWNGDICDGSKTIHNKSGMNIIPQYGNVYEISMTYLGYGNITFNILNPNDGWFTCHVIQYPNQNITTLVTNPSLPLFWHVQNISNNTQLIMYPTCGALFSEGLEKMTGPKYAWDFSKAISVTTLTPLLTIQNKTNFKGYVNKAQLRLKSISYAVDFAATNQLIIGTLQLIRGATLTNSSYFNIDVNNSITLIDTGSTAVSGGVVVFNMNNAKSNTNIIDVSDLDIFLSPGETITFASKSSNAQSTIVGVSVNWVEDI